MELTVLRARAICMSCQSRLPPRMEAWYESESGTTWCETCGRFELQERAIEAQQNGTTDAVIEAVSRVVEDGPATTNLDEPAQTNEEPPPAAPRADRAVAVESAGDDHLTGGDQVVEASSPGPVPPAVHHDAPPLAPLVEAGEGDEDDGAEARRTRSVTSLLGRLRPGGAAADAETSAPPHEWPFERVLATGAGPVLDPEMTLPLDRGDAGEGRVGQTLEAARIHGLEVLHGLRIDPTIEAIDHLVVSANGVWVIRAVPVLAGPLERRDVGDWFTADPRLHIDGEDRSSLVTTVRAQVEAVLAAMVRSSFSDVPVRGVLCFGSVQAGWVKDPFVIDGISVTWRRHVVEPLLEPVQFDVRARTALVHALAGSVSGEPCADPDPDPDADADDGSAGSSRALNRSATG